MSNLKFPEPIRLNGRLYFHREALENYKRSLLNLPPLPADPSAKVELVTAAAASAEFGVNRRTLGRRIARPKDAA